MLLQSRLALLPPVGCLGVVGVVVFSGGLTSVELFEGLCVAGVPSVGPLVWQPPLSHFLARRVASEITPGLPVFWGLQL